MTPHDWADWWFAVVALFAVLAAFILGRNTR